MYTKSFVGIMLFSLLVASVSATNWYVDNSVPTNGNGQSWNTAWNSFSNIQWTSIQPGDKLYISGGTDSQTYYDTLAVGQSGTPDNFVTISGGIDPDHNGQVIISGNNFATTGPGLLVDGKQYVIIRNIEVTQFDGQWGVKIAGQSSSSSSHEIYLQNMKVYENKGAGIYLQGWNAAGDTAYNDNIHVENSEIRQQFQPIDLQTDGLCMQYVQNIYVVNNTITIDNDYPGGPSQNGHNDCICGDHTINNITIVGNKLFNLEHDNYASQVIIARESAGIWKIYNNIIASPDFINWASTVGLWYSTNDAEYYFYGNTFIFGSNNYGLRFQSNSISFNVHLKNNIFQAKSLGYADVARIWFYGDTDGVMVAPPYSLIDDNIYGYNMDASNGRLMNDKTMSQLISLGAETTGNGNLRWNINPKFNDINNEDYTLQSDSPAIDSGLNLGAPYNVDILGVSRPQGAAWDIGAYEYSTGGTNCAPADTNCDGCISLGEISGYVGQWLQGQVSLGDVSTAVSMWLGGC